MKQITRIIAILAIPAAVLSSCDEIRKDKGIIVSEPSVLVCPLSIDNNSEWVIRSQAQYDSLLVEAGCTTVPVDVDFDAYIMLGKFTLSGCNSRYFRQVLKDDDHHSIRYNILIKSRNRICNSTAVSSNWVLVPKFPDNYTVEFNVKKK